MLYPTAQCGRFHLYLRHSMNAKPERTNDGSTLEYLNNIPGTPTPAPFFSQLVWAGDTAYLAGIIALDPTTEKLVEGGIVAETERVLDNIEAVLVGAGLTFANVARVTVYLADIADASKMNEIYTRRIGQFRPAREMMAVSGLAFGAKIEMTVIAYCERR
jgi:2-iminobutanoate/2-iminopropanoate deaminase